MIFLKDTDIFKLRRMDFEIWRRRMLIGMMTLPKLTEASPMLDQ